MGKGKITLLTLSICLSLMFSSCSFVSDDEGAHPKEPHPDIILQNTVYTLGQSGERPVYIESSRITFWSADNRAETDKITFHQADDEGNITLEGSADHADIDTDNRRMDLSGNVRLKRADGNMQIEADELTFDSKNEEINAPGSVHVSSDDGEFRGEGFNADLLTSAYSFKSIQEGVFTL